MISTERPSEATASRPSLGIIDQRIDGPEVGPSSIPVSNTTTPFTGIPGWINPFTQVMLCIKYVCNVRAGSPVKISQCPLSADKKFIYCPCRDINVQSRTIIEHITGEVFSN
jgi:hypothetical protein